MKYSCRCRPRNRSRLRRLNTTDQVGAVTLWCLDCRAEWVSAAKYAATLQVHKPRRRGGMEDSDILDSLNDGSLVVNWATAEVRTHRGPLKVIHRTHIHGANRGTYRFVTVCRHGMKKKIALHRLVWMSYHRRVPSLDCDIDHPHGSVNGDALWNTRELDKRINRANKPDEGTF